MKVTSPGCCNSIITQKLKSRLDDFLRDALMAQSQINVIDSSFTW